MSASTIAIDQEARDKALQAAAALDADLAQLEARLPYLQGFFGDENKLALSVLGSVWMSTSEIREQLPALRQAIRDIPLMDGESS